MKIIIRCIIFLFFIVILSQAQQKIQFIDSVSKEFIERYNGKRHEYNPLHLGDYWQYASESGFLIEYIEKDTIVNELKYFKKFDFRDEFRREGYYYKWERNDTTNNCTYMLDNEDLDNDGFKDDELLLDSLEIPNYYEYISFRRTWKNESSNYPARACVVDSSWIVIFNDTVMSRYVVYFDHFFEVTIADKYGVIFMQPEAAVPIILTGAIIDGLQYGNNVSIPNESELQLIDNISLFQNFPNPFNPVTTIKYDLVRDVDVVLNIYNIQGKKIKELVNGFKRVGSYQVIFDGSGLANGLYFYKIEAGEFTDTKRMLLIK